MKFEMFDSNIDRVKSIVSLRLGLIIDKNDYSMEEEDLREIIGKCLVYIWGGDIDVDKEIEENKNIISKYVSNSEKEEEIKEELSNKRKKMKRTLGDDKHSLIKNTHRYLFNVGDIDKEELEEYYTKVKKRDSIFSYTIEVKFN